MFIVEFCMLDFTNNNTFCAANLKIHVFNLSNVISIKCSGFAVCVMLHF